MRYLAAFGGSEDSDGPGPESRGRDFFSCLPLQLQLFLWKEKDHKRTLLILSNESWIPWEIMKLHTLGPTGLLEGDYLCLHFQLARWFPGSSPKMRFPLSKGGLVCGQGVYGDNLWPEGAPPVLQPLEEISPSLVETQMACGDFDFWFLIGHAFLSDHNPDETYFPLNGGHRLFTQTLNGKAKGLSGCHPLVFLGACSTAREGRAIFGVGGWPKRFIEAKAGAFIGTLWPVSKGDVLHFCETFLRDFKAGQNMAEAFQNARMKTKLAFVLYGHPLATKVDLPCKKTPSPEAPTLSWRHRYRSLHPVVKASLCLGLALLTYLLVWLAGMHAHRTREYYLGLKPLVYPTRELLTTGLAVIWRLPGNGIGALVSRNTFMQWGSLLAISGTILIWYAGICLMRPLFRGMIAFCWAGFLFVILLFISMTARGQSLQHLPDFKAGSMNWVDRFSFDGQLWLVNEGPEYDLLRDNLYGMLLWTLCAIGAGFICLFETRGFWFRFGKLIYMVLGYLGLTLLPRAYAYCNWGVEYPGVQVDSHVAGSDQHLPFEDGCCLFDVSAGATSMVIWMRCSDSEKGSSQTLPEDLVPILKWTRGPKQVVFHAPCANFQH